MLKKLLPFGLTVILLSALIFSGCRRSSVGGGSGNGGGGIIPEVYVSGGYIDNDGAEITCYWDSSGKRYDADQYFEHNWQCLSFYGNELYVAGYYYSSGTIKISYLDATGKCNDQYDLDMAFYGDNMYCGFVYNGQIYTGGQYAPENGVWLPCYWDKDGRHALSEDKTGRVRSIFVNDSGVHAAGKLDEADGESKIFYWQKPNGEPLQVYEIGTGSVTQLVVDNNNDVYISGRNSDGTACYWVWDSDQKEATEHPLDGVWANSIFVSNNQVYIGGVFEDSEKELPCYWESNGNRHSFNIPANAGGYVNSIFVYNNKVYAAGGYGFAEGESEESYACYWDGKGIRHDLNVDGSKASWAGCIWVR